MKFIRSFRWYYQLLMAALLPSACVTIAEVKLPEQKPRLVVNCLFTPDSLWRVALANTRAIGDTQTYTRPAAAQVRLYQDGLFLESLTPQGAGIYVSTLNYPQPGKMYTLEVSAEAVEAVKASDQLPGKTSLKAVAVRTTNPDLSGNIYAIEASLEDPPDQENFYNVVVYLLSEKNDKNLASLVKLEDISLASPLIEVAYDTGRGLSFSDASFNGRAYTLQMATGDSRIAEYQSLIIELRSISKAYFQYEVSLDKQSDTNGSPFVEPVGVFNNIDKGYGIFAGYQLCRDTLDY